MRTFIFPEIPDSNIAGLITRDQFPLIGVYNNIIDRWVMIIISLNSCWSCIPDLYSPILAWCYHPLAFTMETYTSDVVCVTFKGQNGVRVRRLDVIQFNVKMSCSSKVAFIWGDTEAVDLRICMLNCSRANPRECFPEPMSWSFWLVVLAFPVLQRQMVVLAWLYDHNQLLP